MPEAVSRIRVLSGKRVTLGVTGSIAAYKAIGLASALHQAGAIVDVAMTPDAQRFLQPLSFQAITHRPVFADLWAPGMETDIAHVTLGRESDVIVVAPATANMLAKLAHGLADDPVSVTALAARCPVIVAPAMDAGMYTHPATVANVAMLRARGRDASSSPKRAIWPAAWSGLGRLAAPETILDIVRATLGATRRPGRPARAGHRRRHSRSHRPGALHRQSLVGQDGLRHRRSGARPRRGRGPGHARRPRCARRLGCASST